LPIEIAPGQNLWLGIQVAGRAGVSTTEDAEETEESQGAGVRDMAEEWGQENGRVWHSSAVILLPIEIASGQSLWLGIQVAGRAGVSTTEDAEETEESQKYSIVFLVYFVVTKHAGYALDAAGIPRRRHGPLWYGRRGGRRMRGSFILMATINGPGRRFHSGRRASVSS